MSLKGVTGGAAAFLRPYEGVRPRVEQERPNGVAPQPQSVRPPVSGAGLLAPRQETLPTEPPAGTDPELWRVLNSAERAFFSKMTSMGPLTYGRQMSAAAPGAGRAAEAPLARGVRIDVKV